MLREAERSTDSAPSSALGSEFTKRLESALPDADRARRWRRLLRRIRSSLPLLLLAAPLVSWRLVLAFPDGIHLGIGALARLTFVLDVIGHVDGSLLSYLNLGALPSIIGVLLFVIITGWVLSKPGIDS